MNPNLDRKSQLCITCGECCKYFVLEIPKPPKRFVGNDETEEMIEWLEARGVKILKVKDKVIRIKIPMTCPHLFSPNPNEFYCDIYEWRPVVCKRFDGRLDGEPDLQCKWKGEKLNG